MSSRPLTALTLIGAALASLATGASDLTPTTPTVTPIAPYTHADLLAPGTSVVTDFRVGAQVALLGQIQTSWATASALVPAQEGTAQLEITLDGAFDGDGFSLEINADEPWEDSVLVDGLMSGCATSGDLCWTTWTLTVSHVGGADDAEVHWAFDTLLQGSGGSALTHSVLEL